MRVIVATVLVACGSNGDPVMQDATPVDDVIVDGVLSGIDTPPSPMALTSSAFADGTAIPAAHTCDGADTSMPLAWTSAPAGTQSFAITFRDRTVGVIHSVIYDIPGTLAALPVGVEETYAPANVPGAHQSLTLGGVTHGYTGPCPPPGMPAHTYELELFALGVAVLPGADMSTTQSQARTLILQHDLASTKLSGTYQR